MVTRPERLKFRLLISGLSQTGKTTSLPSFIYGPHDFFSTEQDEVLAAIEYAADKHMVILTCPGEFGFRSLPPDTPHISSYHIETDETDDVKSVQFSIDALDVFHSTYQDVMKNKPDIIAFDGIHSLWDHIMNKVTGGLYLQGEDLNYNPLTGRSDPYRSAKYHDMAHNTFGNVINSYYLSSTPLIVCTTWEDWKTAKSDMDKIGVIESQRYLWPDIPGKMATRIVGKFDASVSARLERRCYHSKCEDMAANNEHYVWQFLARGDVRGVGIKGLRPTDKMKQVPYIHQNYEYLKQFIERFV